MRIIARVLAAVAVTAGAALASSGPAQAESQVIDGVFTYTQPDGLTADWTIYPTCVPVVGDLREPLYLPVGCVLHVESNSPGITGGAARLTNGLWTYQVSNLEGLTCPDGSTEPIRETVEFSTDTMSGTRTTLHPPACNDTVPAAMIKTPFTIARIGNTPLPVDNYPLICEPGGLRRCF
ncbi:hypothetical protein ACN27E_01915 [Mycobacterium sp. WMMD1722]|uniref:hypothetical protein n=1 Tax=Mycobacterium sp. WMMD1722 TaxID=3404117 RepID=UPI003BF5A041